MSPPAKKRRFAPGGAPAAPTASSDDLAARHAGTVKSLREDVAALLSSTSGGGAGSAGADGRLASSVLNLATLKSLQRLLAHASSSRSDASRSRREEAEERSLVLEAAVYERRHLRGEIDAASGWRADGLAGMAWSELGIERTGDGEEDGEEGEEEGEEADAPPSEKKEEGDEEMEDAAPGAAAAKPRNDEEAIDAYLFDGEAGRSHRDPSERDAVVSKLRSNLKARGDLVAGLSSARSELAELKRKRDELRGFLDQIPKKVGEMDRAARGLGRFFARHGAWNHGGGEGGEGGEDRLRDASLLEALPSGDRADRYRLASSGLPSPLYALFVQLTGLAGASDAASGMEGGGGAAAAGAGLVPSLSGIAVRAVPPDDGKGGGGVWTVELAIPTSGILDAESSSALGRPKSSQPAPLVVVFSFDREAGCVRAKADGDDPGVLAGLFPGGDGLVRPNAVSEALRADDYDEEGGGEGTAAPGDGDPRGRPYYWCQVLAGLDLPPPPPCAALRGDADGDDNDDDAGAAPFRAEACASSFLRALLRRLRARHALSAILDLLSRGGSRSHPLPVHPSLARSNGGPWWSDPSSPPRARVHSWTAEAAPAPDGTRTYAASVRRKGHPHLRAAVSFRPGSYPAVPPVWSLRNEDGSTGGGGGAGPSAAGGGGIDSLAADSGPLAPPLVDASLRSIEARVNTDHAGLVDGDDEGSFDWILLHQLGAIVSCWDAAVSSEEGGGGTWTGRDRTPSAGALRLYRCGL